MKCNLIFYIAEKTSYCQIALSRCLKTVNFTINQIKGTTTPETLGNSLSQLLNEYDVCFVIGGLGESGKKGVKNVLSGALTNKNIPPENICKLSVSNSAKEGFVIRCGKQIIVLLPDDPEIITLLFNAELVKYLNKFSELK